MNYQKITKCDTANGIGVRVVLWVSGCEHHCKGCHNPQTWDVNSGQLFTQESLDELIEALNKPWIAGLTLSGGDPFHPNNVGKLAYITNLVKLKFPEKTIWCYTGYSLCDLLKAKEENMAVAVLMSRIDILVDGEYKEELRDVSFPWAGSSNQKVWAKDMSGNWVLSKYNVRKKV